MSARTCLESVLKSTLELRDARVEQHGAYIVTSGTGEGDFCYRVADVVRWLQTFVPVPRDKREDGGDEPYTSFCRAVSPVATRRLAFRFARLGFNIANEGCCRPVLSDAEFRAVYP